MAFYSQTDSRAYQRRGPTNWRSRRRGPTDLQFRSRGRTYSLLRDRHAAFTHNRGEHYGGDRRGRGRGSVRSRGRLRTNWNRERPVFRPIIILSVEELASLEPGELVIRVNAQLKQFQEAIGDPKNSMNFVIQILLTLVKLAGQRGDSEQQGTASKIIAEILSERSDKFHFQLKRTIQGISCTIEQAKYFCDLFKSMLTTFESLASECLPIDELHETVKRLTKAGEIDSTLLKKSEDVCELRNQILDKEENPVILASVERNDSDYKHIPILPEWEEIKEDNGTPQEVRPNKIDTPYKDWLEYYDIQFRLIREDFIAPLRRGVAAFLQGERGRKNRDVKTYSSAKIVSQVTTKDKGICFSIQFDVSGFRKVNYNWNHSKQLIFGSLLCFIPVDKSSESSVIFATVAKRDIDELYEGIIMVHFEGDILQAIAHFENQTKFEMIESSSYFEATAPILRSIQTAEVETMPFTKQIILGDCSAILPPVYLRANEEPPVYNLACLRGPRRCQFINILNKESWEAVQDSELDSSQLNAIQTALTQEIAVIQGPPGTGKTYIGRKIVEGLLENRHIWDPHKSSPILVMCYTNHALDQFLEDIIDTKCCGRELEVIRVGGRCKNKKVDAHNIKKVRMKQTRKDPEIKELEYELFSCNPQRIFEKLKSNYNRCSLLPLSHIKAVVDPYHYYQLSQMVKCKEQKGNEIEVWLGLWSEKSLKSKGRDQLTDTRMSQMELVDIYKRPRNMLDLDSLAIFAQDEKMDDYDAEDERMDDYDSEDERMDDYDAEDERMDDYDAEEYEVIISPYKDEDEQTFQYYHEEYSDDESENEEITQTKPQRYRRENADKVIAHKLFGEHMDEDEANEIYDINALSYTDRWRLYNFWEEQQYKHLQKMNRQLVQDYTENYKKLDEHRKFKDIGTLERADVVGMTTTGAAKYQHILHRIKPKIVIVEEAAEVLEAHIVSALSAGTQHLILIGDHKQLRPKPNENVLATKYNLSTSLFERLVMKQMSQATLKIQHRMRPEIAQLVCPHIYKKLLNDDSVKKYNDIRGIEKNMFFVCHTEPESEDPNLLSYQNEFEANYIVGLCSHLLNLGYSPTQITILTPYVGQLLLLKNKIAQTIYKRVRVTAIDNFQGEENDIILFSMVRSTNPHSNKTTIGFMKEDNRVCVSLSRAKQGFYAIGNFELIRHQTPLWESIISDVESRGCYGNALPLYCCNHPKTKYSAKKESDFIANALNGGCMRMCDIRLPCGHSCPQICHARDREHSTLFECKKPCVKNCKNNHPCKSKHECCKECPKCTEVVVIIRPECGHEQRMECWRDKLEQGTEIMHYSKSKCAQIVTKIMPSCQHTQSMACSTNPLTVLCKAPCDKRCNNGHPCQKVCSESCGNCQSMVEKVIPGCNHKQMVPCYRSPHTFYCQAEVEKQCQNGMHTLKKLCCEEWPQCSNKVTKQIPNCGHIVELMCFEDPSTILCNKPCDNMCEFGHKCSKLCHEECIPCLYKVNMTLSCGHSLIKPCSIAHKDSLECLEKCLKVNCSRGHLCQKTCHYPKSCGPCEEPVTIQLPSCSHDQIIKCYMSVNPEKYGYKCRSPCKRKLPCSHKCLKKCGYNCQIACMESVQMKLKCGHHTSIECYRKSQRELLVVNCKKQLKVKLSCGHTLRISCWRKDYKSVLDKECNKSCKRILGCGHTCQEKCSNPCTTMCTFEVKKRLPCGHELYLECYKAQKANEYPCNEPCTKKLPCGHSCNGICGQPCLKCNQISARRYPCGHSSKIPCSSSISENPCKKKCRIVLSCGHRCSGRCGDCYSSRMHAICVFEIRLRRFCGHSLTLPCAGLSDSCDQETHEVSCTHKQDYRKCHERCSWACEHFQCERECGEECDRPPCNEPCNKEMFCGHICPGLCGERCTSVCAQCYPNKFMKQFHPKPKEGQLPGSQVLFELECGHIFTVKYLDEYLERPEGVVLPKQCPKCHQTIGVGSRYGNAVRRAQADVQSVIKIKEYKCETLSEESVENYHEEGFSICIHQILSMPKNNERDCLVQCFNSFVAIFIALNHYTDYLPCTFLTDIKKPVLTLFERVKCEKSGQVSLTFEVMDDFKSELYRLTLLAQCMIAKNKHSPTITKKIKLMPEQKDAVESIQEYIQNLDPQFDRIPEEKYQELCSQLKCDAPDLPHLNVCMPQVPRVLKGVWRKCLNGHFFCTRYVCNTKFKPCAECPDCKKLT